MVQQYLFLGIGILVIGFLFYKTTRYLFERRIESKKRKAQQQNTGTTQPADQQNTPDVEYPPIQALIWNNDNLTGGYISTIDSKTQNRIIKDKDNGYGLGRQWSYMGKLVYEFIKTGESYIPTTKYILALERNPHLILPSQIYDKAVQPEIAITRRLSGQQSSWKDYMGSILVWSAVIAFIIFMIVSSK